MNKKKNKTWLFKAELEMINKCINRKDFQFLKNVFLRMFFKTKIFNSVLWGVCNRGEICKWCKVQRGEIEINCKAVHHMWSDILHKGK